MSDWDDECEPASKPASKPVSSNFKRQNNDDWDDEPTMMPERNRRSNNNYTDHKSSGGEQIDVGVSQSSVGLIIGRGGSKIKELEQRYNVSLRIGKSNGYYNYYYWL